MNSKPKGRMTVHEVDVAAERRSKSIKVAALTAVSVVVLTAGGALAWYFTPPALPTTLEEAIAVANSPRYKRLSKDQKEPYLDVIRERFGSLDREERRKMLGDDEAARNMARDAMRGMWMGRMKAFGAATFEERREMLAQMPQRPERPQRPPGEGRDPGQMRNRVSDRMANGNAQNMANMGEFIRQRQKQREQR